MRSQCDRILAYLRRGRSLTPLSAYKLCGTWAMHSRAAELRARGHNIRCRVVNKGRVKHGVYWLA